jgi:hypothetical protein
MNKGVLRDALFVSNVNDYDLFFDISSSLGTRKMANEIPSFTDSKKLVEALTNVLISWALYRQFTYFDQTNTEYLPKLMEMYCDDPACRKVTWWYTKIYDYTLHFKAFREATYECRNCQRAQVIYHFHWTRRTDSSAIEFIKFGQWPALEKRISPELKKHFFGNDYELYQKALRCRSQNLGIGALAYLRRVVENRTNELLDMLAEEAKQAGTAIELNAIAEAKKSFKFSEKIELAQKIIPPTLRPGNHNPIDQLHDIASEGLHWKDEAECATMFDKAGGVFEFLFQEMERRKNAASEFHKALSEIATRNS